MPHYARYPIWLLLWKPVRKFLNVVVIPNIPISSVRIFLYRAIGYQIGKNVFIGMKCYLDDLNPSALVIRDNVAISYAVKFAVHGVGCNKDMKIIIEDDAYIGMGSILISGKRGITIGRYAVIGAGSVVVSSIPPCAVAAGNPARVMSYVRMALRNPKEQPF